MARRIRIVVDGEIKWVPVEITQITEEDGSSRKKFKIVRERKLKGRAKLWGYTHTDYKEWGEQGGRPRKWESEAERKRAFRLRKKQEKLGEKVELRGYKKGEKKK